MKNSFAKNLRLIRQLRGFTQQQFADTTELRRNTIALYETGRRECDFDTLISLTKVLKCSTDDLLLEHEGANYIIEQDDSIVTQKGKGYIYILTNPSFPDYVKIGYADNVENRLQQLNNSECTPYAFRVYATYEVDSRLSDMKIHSIIDKLNPDLRSIDNFNGKKRVREFYAMTAEDAYSILEAIAEIHNFTDRLVKWEVTAYDKKAEEIAETVQMEKKEKHSVWTFDDWQIPDGAILEYINDPAVKCTVVSRRKVEFEGEIFFMTPLAKKVSGNDSIVHGPGWVAQNFKYNGELIEDIEKRIAKSKG